MAKVSVLGSGTWGMALAMLLFQNGHDVTVWSAIPEEITAMQATKEVKNLPGSTVPDGICLTADIDMTRGSDILVMAVPSIFVRQTAAKLRGHLKGSELIVIVAKGIEDKSLKLLTEVVEDELPGIKVCVLSGPSHAEEVAKGLPTTCVAGAKDIKDAEYIQSVFMSPVFRVYTSTDLVGIELGGALKNVIALAAGVADGIGCGDNTKAALITRGIHEITRLGTALGGRAETFSGLTGIGDLIVTCASMHSRNRRAGILMGQGKSMQEAMQTVNMTVEGVYSARAGLALAEKCGVSVPIIEQVNLVLFNGKSAREALNDLMLRDRTSENS